MVFFRDFATDPVKYTLARQIEGFTARRLKEKITKIILPVRILFERVRKYVLVFLCVITFVYYTFPSRTADLMKFSNFVWSSSSTLNSKPVLYLVK